MKTRLLKEIIPAKLSQHVQSVALIEDGAVITLNIEDGEKKIFLTHDQVSQLWGTLTLALDCACMGSLSSKIRRNGLWDVMQSAMGGIKMVREDKRQATLPFKEAVEE